jgi:uncharacterized surface protein with fasciclin (FAS1) repeats
MKNVLVVLLLAATTISAGACKKKQTEPPAAQKSNEGSAAIATGSAAVVDPAKPAEPAATKNLIETAKAAGNFTTLLKAIDAAGITTTLSGAGPFTVFAPTDDAFAKLPAKDLEALLADKTKLEKLLQYHVVAGALSSKDLATQKSLKTIEGADVALDVSSGIKIGDAKVVTPDVIASNGVIHAIDTVLVVPN